MWAGDMFNSKLYIIRMSGFSPEFSDNILKPKRQVESTPVVPKEVLFLNIEFKRDNKAEILDNRPYIFFGKIFFIQ